MKRYLIPILIVLLIVAGIIYIPDMIQTPDELTKESTSPQSPTHDELQTQIEALQNELNRQREQKKAEILKQAEAFNAIVEFCYPSYEPRIEVATIEAFKEMLVAASNFWRLIKDTGDIELISRCQPRGEWGLTPCGCSQVRDYAEAMYKSLMAEYNSL